MKNFRQYAALAIFIALPGVAASQPAQDFPRHEVKIVVPSPPGGGTDNITRLLADAIGRQLGQRIIVENKPGAGTTIGMAAAAASPADGYTLVANGDTVAIFENLYANLKFDTFRDFAPVAYMASAPIALAARAGFPANNVGELVALARKEPGKVTYAAAGAGTPHDLAGLMLAYRAQIRFTEIQYRGNGPALSDLLGGHVDVGMFTLSNVLPHVQSGKMKILALVGNQRSSSAPDIPSMKEAGLPGVDVSLRYLLLAPAATPAPVISRLHAAVIDSLKAPHTVEALKKIGYEPLITTTAEAAAMLRSERDRWAPLLKAANIKPE